MRSVLPLTLTLLLADLVTAQSPYWDYCYDPLPPLKSDCCPKAALPRRDSGRSLFRRTKGCPLDASTTPCCTEEGPVIKISTDSLPLQCGRTFTETGSDVIFTIGTCPPSDVYDGHTQCLHITPSLDDSIVGYVTDTSLQYSKVPLTADNTPNGLGNWNGNKYCDKSNGVCDLPLDVITYGSPICPGPVPVYLAYHVSTSKGDTCFARSDPPRPIDTRGRWFLFFELDFTCKDDCINYCCCKNPPVETKFCGVGTAFGYNEACDPTGKNPCRYDNYYLKDVCNSNRWGWWHRIPKDSLPYESSLYVDAGQNNIVSNGKLVGKATLYKCLVDKICVKYELNNGYSIAQAHVDVQCTEPKETTGGGEKPCAPGQYDPFQATCPAGGSTWTASANDPRCDIYYYAIFHAAITRSVPITDTCTPVDCTTYSDPDSGP